MGDTISTPCMRLQEADQAYHDLMTGAMARSVTDENGEMVSFTQANKDALLSYIRQLAPMCPAYQVTALGAMQTRAPMRFLF